MSEHIVHTGILEDSFTIAPYLSAIPEDFARVMREYIGIGRLGCITVAGDQFTFKLLEQFKPQWKKRDEILEAKLAFVLGWVSHRACDRQMKPIWNIAEMMTRGTDADPSVSPTECSVYHEGEMYNRYYSDDPVFKLAIFRDEMNTYPCAELFKTDEAAELIQSSYGVNMMNIQTFDGSLSNQRFMEMVCERAQKFYVDVSRYTRAAGSPNPAYKAEYVTDIKWFDENDDILKVAKKLRTGSTLDSEQCDRAMEIPAESHYGLALQLSLRYIIAAADYFRRDEMSMDELMDRLDIGKKGRKGMSV